GLLLFFFLFVFYAVCLLFFFFFSSRRRHTRSKRDWSSDVCSSDLITFRSNKVLTVFYIFFVHYINSPSYKLKIIIAQALINKNMMNDREIYTAIRRDC